MRTRVHMKLANKIGVTYHWFSSKLTNESLVWARLYANWSAGVARLESSQTSCTHKYKRAHTGRAFILRVGVPVAACSLLSPFSVISQSHEMDSDTVNDISSLFSEPRKLNQHVRFIERSSAELNTGMPLLVDFFFYLSEFYLFLPLFRVRPWSS